MFYRGVIVRNVFSLVFCGLFSKQTCGRVRSVLCYSFVCLNNDFTGFVRGSRYAQSATDTVLRAVVCYDASQLSLLLLDIKMGRTNYAPEGQGRLCP